MFNEPFSIRALLARSPLVPAAPAVPVRPVPRLARVQSDACLPEALTPMPGLLRTSASADCSAFFDYVTPLAPAQAACGGLRRVVFRTRRPPRYAQLLAQVYPAAAGQTYSFSQLRSLQPRGCRLCSAVDKLLEYGFLERVAPGVYQRTGLRFTGAPSPQEPPDLAALRSFIARSS